MTVSELLDNGTDVRLDVQCANAVAYQLKRCQSICSDATRGWMMMKVGGSKVVEICDCGDGRKKMAGSAAERLSADDVCWKGCCKKMRRLVFSLLKRVIFPNLDSANSRAESYQQTF